MTNQSLQNINNDLTLTNINFDLLLKYIKQSSSNKQIGLNMEIDYNSSDYPYKHFRLNNVYNSNQLKIIKNFILQHLEFKYKNNDLFTFKQSDNLHYSNIPINSNHFINKDYVLGTNLLKDLIKQLYSLKFKTFLEDFFQVKLNENLIDLSASIYQKTDYLMCHNDMIRESNNENKNLMSERKIAFVLYLVDENWSELDGGYLELLESLQNDQIPVRVVKKLLPKWNSIVLFKISDISYHQVSEVLGQKDRVSLVGWFHGPVTSKQISNHSQKHKTPKNEIYRINEPISYACDTIFKTMFNREYFKANSINRINEVFSEESCIQLESFMDEKLYLLCCSELEALEQTDDLIWEYESEDLSFRKNKTLNLMSLKQTNINKLLDIFKSSEMMEYMTELSGLKLNKYILGKIRRYKQGDYSMINDKYIKPVGLDISLYFLKNKYKENSEYGGSTYYVADKDTLISRKPAQNTLYMVYRDDDVHKFTKYVDSNFKQILYEFVITYIE